MLEGLDGSGKATQAGLLYEALCGRGEQAMKITFPNYAPMRRPAFILWTGMQAIRHFGGAFTTTAEP